MKRILNITLLTLTIITVLSCRQQNNEKDRIESIGFQENFITVSIGDVLPISVMINPKNGKDNDNIEYSVSNPSVVKVLEGSAEGVVIEALERGSIVLTARTREHGLSAFVNITVRGTDANTPPHIVLPFNVLMMPVNATRNVTVSLAGGTEVDNANFTFANIENNAVEMESTGNVAIIRSVELGETIIRINHPKAAYPIDLLVYVLGTDEIPVYITTNQNIIRLNNDGALSQFTVDLVGGNNDDMGSFAYFIADGTDVIDLTGNGKIGSIIPRKEGTALIEVHHPKARFPLQIQVIVTAEMEFNYIELDSTVIIIENERSRIINAKFIGNEEIDARESYSFTLSDPDVVFVENAQEVFYINPLRTGRTILTIENEHADFPREVLIIVNFSVDIFSNNERYIWTNQNLISMEIGQTEAVLRMTLVGGNEADRNNFVWIVEDSSVIEVTGSHGRVVEDYYEFNRQRSMIATSSDTFVAEVLIKPLRTGTSRIRLQHPKSDNDCTVVVKVYPRNTFGTVPLTLSGRNNYRIGIGEKVEIDLNVINGNANNIGTLTWTVEDEEIAHVSGTGLKGVIEGKGSGITRLRVDGDNLRTPFEAVILSGSEAELKQRLFIYMLNPYMSMAKGTQATNRVFVSWPEEVEEGIEIDLIDLRELNVINRNPEIVRTLYFNGDIVIDALEAGKAEIVIRGAGTNEIIMTVIVEEEAVNPNTPFYLNMDTKIIGIVKGEERNVSVNLVGAAVVQNNNIVWSSANNAVVGVTGSGASARITGSGEGITKINVSHPRSVNSYELVVYVVSRPEDLQGKVAFYTEKQNYLINRNDTIFIELLTNADEEQRRGINWQISNTEIISIDVNSNNTTALITARQAGTTRIVVTHPDQIFPMNIYISVTNEFDNTKVIGVPSIIEGVVGNAFNIEAVTKGLNGIEISDITWSTEDTDIINLLVSRGIVLVTPRKSGQAIITVKQNEIGYENNILVFIYDTYEELVSGYVMGIERSHIRMATGDSIDLSLIFGIRQFPDNEIANISWSATENNVVSVSGNGARANVRAMNTGVARITARSGIANDVVIEVEVKEVLTGIDKYTMFIEPGDRISGIPLNTRKDIEVKLFSGNRQITTGLRRFEFEAEDTSIVRINQIENVVSIQGLRSGSTYINVTHPDVEQRERIFVYVGTQQELDGFFPVHLERNNYLMRIGDSARIHVWTLETSQSELQKLSYEAAFDNGSIIINEVSKLEINVTAMAKGNEIINIKHDGRTVQRIFISVTENSFVDEELYIFTESVIGVVKGQEYTARISANFPQAARESVLWQIEDSNIAMMKRTYTQDNGEEIVYESVIEQGMSALITGVSTGRTYINIGLGNIERKVLVVVVENESELERINAINIDRRDYTLGINQRLNLKINSFNGAEILGNTIYQDHLIFEGNFGNVIEIENSSNDGAVIRGVNEGIAAIRISNSFYAVEMVVFIEVRNNTLTGSVNDPGVLNFLTTDRTLYIIQPEERDVTIDVRLTSGPNIWGGYFRWTGYDRDIIDVRSIGSTAIINPKKTGETVLSVTHDTAERPLEITIIVGERYTRDKGDEPYIESERDIYDVFTDDEIFFVDFKLINKDINDIVKRDITVTGDSAVVVLNENNFSVTPRNLGMTRVTLDFDGIIKHFYILVRMRTNTELVYLTTNNNYIITGINNLTTAEARLLGFNELDSNNFIWSINRPEVARIIGNGNIGQIQPLAYGDAVITVRHSRAENDLQIYLRVSRDAAMENAVYLTTRTNVIETLVNDSIDLVYVEKIGGNPNITNAVWRVDNGMILDVTGNGLTGQITSKRAGIARITVTHPEARRPLNIVVIVREPSGTDLYITTQESLLIYEPGTMNNRITVQLVGGEPSDNSRFVWSIHHQQAADLRVAHANDRVISIVANGSECNINALNDGIARIRVSHDKADEPLYITVQVSRQKEIEFGLREITVLTNSSAFVELKVPTYDNFNERITFTSDNPNVQVFGTSNAVLLGTGEHPGLAIVKARIDSINQETELAVNVVKELHEDINRIIVPRSSYVLNPRSGPVRMTAYVVGSGVEDKWDDDITWRVNGTGLTLVDIFPNPGRGREIQIVPKTTSEILEGSFTITASHPLVDPSFNATIFVSVTEHENMIRLDKNVVELMSNRTEYLEATILSGRASDYNELVWRADHKIENGIAGEVVRIMGSGRRVLLYPFLEGEVWVTVWYRGRMAECKVIVRNANMFQFHTESVVKSPGGPAVRVGYDVRPGNAHIEFFEMKQNAFANVIQFAQVATENYIEIHGLEAGTTTIVGVSNGRQSRVTVTVRENYRVTFFNEEGRVGTVVDFEPRSVSDNSWHEVEYLLYPENTRIRAISDVPDGFSYEVGPANEEGKGVIRFRSLVEIPRFNLTFVQERFDRETNEWVTVNTRTSLVLSISPRYTTGSITPKFVRQQGVWSNNNGETGRTGVGTEEDLPIVTVDGVNRHRIIIGDGEEHYIIFNKPPGQEGRVAIFPVNRNQDLSGDNDPYELGLQTIEHNGVTRTVLRVSGKEDHIEYTRFAFLRDLFVDIRTDSHRPIFAGTEPAPHERTRQVRRQELTQSGWVNIEPPIWDTEYEYSMTMPPEVNPSGGSTWWTKTQLHMGVASRDGGVQTTTWNVVNNTYSGAGNFRIATNEIGQHRETTNSNSDYGVAATIRVGVANGNNILNFDRAGGSNFAIAWNIRRLTNFSTYNNSVSILNSTTHYNHHLYYSINCDQCRDVSGSHLRIAQPEGINHTGGNTDSPVVNLFINDNEWRRYVSFNRIREGYVELGENYVEIRTRWGTDQILRIMNDASVFSKWPYSYDQSMSQQSRHLTARSAQENSGILGNKAWWDLHDNGGSNAKIVSWPSNNVTPVISTHIDKNITYLDVNNNAVTIPIIIEYRERASHMMFTGPGSIEYQGPKFNDFSHFR